MTRLLATLLLLTPGLSACRGEGCLRDTPDCRVPSPCPTLAFTCADGFAEVRRVGPDDPLRDHPLALAAPGDVWLANEHVVAVIDALDHPRYLATSGGGLVDLYLRDAENESLRHVLHGTGLLPGDAAHYTSLEILDEGEVKAVQLKGTLFGRPGARIATRYEIRPCEPGIRIRTEVVNEEADPQSWLLGDGWYWGGRESLPFVPVPGGGFDHPPLELSTVPQALRDAPYMVAGAHSPPAATYATVACDAPTLTGFQSVEVSLVGKAPRIVMPGDWEVFERFVGVGDGASIAAGADIALEVRRQLFGEAHVELEGRVEAPGGRLGDTLRASLTVSEGSAATPRSLRVPWTQVFPRPDGSFRVRVPAGRSYVVTAEAFGRKVGEWDVTARTEAVDLGTLVLPEVGEITLDATVDGARDHVLAFVLPADTETETATAGRMFGHFDRCAPLLGDPNGPGPACDRVLLDGPTTVALPPGRYDVFASAGPFSTLAAVRGVVVDGRTGQSVLLEIATLPLQPPGTLSGDFHAHGLASFDSAIPDEDRVRSFLAARVEVVVASEHDTAWDYARAMEALGARERMHLVVGTEATGHILWNFRPDSPYPRVFGHWNAWPLPFDPLGPWRGAPWDERAEPGTYFDRLVAAGWPADEGVLQLNHPIGGMQFGRDFGWASALELDLTRPLPEHFDGTSQSLFRRVPPGAAHANDAYHAQEVMNGTRNESLLAYRALWFHLLDRGIVRAGTANSDTHTLTENIAGTPRNLVFSDTTFADFDLAVFDRAVREGRMIGTNGPVILVATRDASGRVRGPSVEPFVPDESADLEITVTAAPWVPVDEVRVVVSGRVVRIVTDLPVPADPFGVADLQRLRMSIPLRELLPATGDAWIVVEAGAPLPAHADLDCDGIPDTGDNDGNGTIDWRDVDGLEADPGTDCLSTVGPLGEPPEPERGSPAWLFRTVVPGGYPAAFTNPLVLDRDGDGFRGIER